MKNVIFSIILLFPVLIFGQKDSSNSTKIWDIIEIRQSFGTTESKKEPAVFQFTIPEKGKNSYLIDGAIAVKFGKERKIGKGKLNMKFAGEYHRNTLIDEEQNNWQLGLSSNIRSAVKQRGNVFRQTYYNPTLKYSNDRIDSSESFIVTSDINFFKTGGRINLNTYTYSNNRRTVHLLSVAPGFEFQNYFAAKDFNKEGSIFRPVYKIQYLIAGNRKAEDDMIRGVNKSIEFFINYSGRYDILNSTENREYYTHLLKTGIDYYLLNDPLDVTIGISFNRGSNPLQGLKNQQFWLFTLSIQK